MASLESVISEILKSGKSTEELAADFNKILNDVEAKRKVSSERDKYLKNLLNNFDSNLDNDVVNFDSAIDLVVYYVALRHPDWTIEDIKQYQDMVKMNLDTLARFVKEDPVKVAGEELSRILGDHFVSTNNRKSNDKLTIEDFLRSL